ncbi:MAG: hypothetical protein V1698_01040 [bacterium]
MLDKEKLENSIFSAISFYDAMNLPITPLEIYRNLAIHGGEKMEKSFASSLKELDFPDFLCFLEANEAIKQKTVRKNGMYFLLRREKKEETDGSAVKSNFSWFCGFRQIKYRAAIKKWLIVRWMVMFFEAVPFVEAVFSSGSITRDNTTGKSDIDLLIVAEYGRIWTVRAFAIFAAKILCRYRSGEKVKDMFCLNHFISDKDLEIKHRGIYTAELYSKLVPVFYRDEDFLKDFRRKNEWIKEYLPLWSEPAPSTFRKFRSGIFFRPIRAVLEFLLSGFIGDWIENFFRALQAPKIAKGAGKIGGRIIFTEQEIELHPDSPERRIVDELNERMSELSLRELTSWQDSGLEK